MIALRSCVSVLWNTVWVIRIFTPRSSKYRLETLLRRTLDMSFNPIKAVKVIKQV